MEIKHNSPLLVQCNIIIIIIIIIVIIIIIIITRFSCRRQLQGASADKLHVKAAKFLPLVGLARSKQDPINRGHGAQYLYRRPPAGAKPAVQYTNIIMFSSNVGGR